MAHAHESWIYGVVEREFRQEGPTTVVKLGRVGTRPLHKRLAQYPKDSVCLFAFGVQSGMDAVVEAAVLGAARKMFKERRDIGAEYIEAPAGELMALVGRIATPFLAIARTAAAGGGGDEESVVEESDESVETHSANGRMPMREAHTSVECMADEGDGDGVEEEVVDEEEESVDAEAAVDVVDVVVDLPMLVYKYIGERRAELSEATVPVASLFEDVCKYVKAAGAKRALSSGRLTNILEKDWKVKATMAYDESGPVPAYTFITLTAQPPVVVVAATHDADPFEWLQSLVDTGVIQITGSRNDFIKLGALNEYKASSSEHPHTRLEVAHVKIFFGQKYKESVSIRCGSSKVGRGRVSVKNAIVGCKLNVLRVSGV
jgi:hypothetical protein